MEQGPTKYCSAKNEDIQNLWTILFKLFLYNSM